MDSKYVLHFHIIVVSCERVDCLGFTLYTSYLKFPIPLSAERGSHRLGCAVSV